MRTPNHGLCNGGLPLYMFRLLAQYGSATCTAQNCSSGALNLTCIPADDATMHMSGCYPYEGGASSGDTGQQSGDGFNGRFKGNHNRWERRRRTRHWSPHAQARDAAGGSNNFSMLLQQWAPAPPPNRCSDNQCELGGHNVRQCVFAAEGSADCITLGYWSPHAPTRIMREVGAGHEYKSTECCFFASGVQARARHSYDAGICTWMYLQRPC